MQNINRVEGEKIVIHGARVHNLKNISVEIPRNKLVVISGLSGSGKSSLAFDTLFAEGQRRYMESLSSYARQFWEAWTNPMSIRLKVFRLQFLLSRKQPTIILALQLEQLLKFTTITVFCLQEPGMRIVLSAEEKLRNSRTIRLSIL